MAITPQHFEGCHPGHRAPPFPPLGHIPQDTEQCWHCGILTGQGCYCLMCAARAKHIPPGVVYHCLRCSRWWAYDVDVAIVGIVFPYRY